jgi:Family of unknown function (DUF6850)
MSSQFAGTTCAWAAVLNYGPGTAGVDGGPQLRAWDGGAEQRVGLRDATAGVNPSSRTPFPAFPPARALALALALTAATLVQATSPAAAQTPASNASQGMTAPDWLARWSPLLSADQASVPAPGAMLDLPQLLELPGPRIGMFWTGGNPAGLAGRVADQRSRFDLTDDAITGAYRRPLDAGDEHHATLSAVAWQPMGGESGVIGHVAVDRATLGAPVYSDVADPFTLSPLLVVDTASGAMSRTTARLEGAGGMRVGPLLLGASLAYQAQQSQTVASPVPHLDRVSMPGIILGAAVPLRGVRVGAYGRWRETRESIRLYSVAAPSRIYQFYGYDEPQPQDIIGTYFTRERRGFARGGGLTADGTVRGLRWTLYADAGNQDDRAWSDISANHPATDRWNASARSAGGALQTTLAGGAIVVTAQLDWNRLSGDLRRADFPGVSYTGSQEILSPGIDVRATSPSGWLVALRITDPRQERQVSDSIAQRLATFGSWTPSAAFAVARRVAPGVSLGFAAGIAHVAVGGGIPDPASMGAVYDQYLAPASSLYVTPASALDAALDLRWDATAHTSFFLRAARDRLTPGSGLLTLPYTPTGQRTDWTLDLGAMLAGS